MFVPCHPYISHPSYISCAYPTIPLKANADGFVAKLGLKPTFICDFLKKEVMNLLIECDLPCNSKFLK
jgi:hypothetical protein